MKFAHSVLIANYDILISWDTMPVVEVIVMGRLKMRFGCIEEDWKMRDLDHPQIAMRE
jgi:hypothetical protein